MAFTPRTETYINVSSLSTPFNATVTKPTGTADGDIMFQLWSWNAAVTIDSVPSGWFLVAQNIANTDRYALYFKVASGEGASWVWSWTATAKVRGCCSVYAAGDFSVTSGTLAQMTVSNTQYRTSDGNIRAAAMTVPDPNSPLLFFGSVYSVNSTRSTAKPTTPTTGWVEDDDIWSTTSDFQQTVCSYIWTGSGTTGAMDAVMASSATGTTKHAFAVALRPKAFSMTAGTEAYSEAGTAVSLKATRVLPAASGSFSMVGTAVVMTRGHKIAAEAAAFVMSGTAVALKRNSKVAAGAGTYSLSGTAVGLKAARKLAAGAGAYSLVGSDVTLTYVEAATAYKITAEPGAFSLAGTATALKATRKMAAAAGAFSLAGTAVAMKRARTLVASPGAFSLAGTPAALARASKLIAAAGGFSLAGSAVALTYLQHYKLTAGAGSFLFSGKAVGLNYSGGAAPSGGDYPLIMRRRRR